MKWNESGVRPPLCTYRLNWARRTSWGWRLLTILTFTRGWRRNIFDSFKPPRPGTEPRTLAWKAAVLTTTLGPPPSNDETISSNFPVCLRIVWQAPYRHHTGIGAHLSSPIVRQAPYRHWCSPIIAYIIWRYCTGQKIKSDAISGIISLSAHYEVPVHSQPPALSLVSIFFSNLIYLAHVLWTLSQRQIPILTHLLVFYIIVHGNNICSINQCK